jgi:hypothetical protein
LHSIRGGIRISKSNTLYTVYDLEKWSMDFNALSFLALAELERLEKGFADIHFVVLPPTESQKDEKGQRFRDLSLMLEAVGMVHNVLHVSTFSRRSEALSFIEGIGEFYSGALGPNGNHLFPLIEQWNSEGASPRNFTPSKIAAVQVDGWLRRVSNGKKRIVLALAPNAADRTEDMQAWATFIQTLDSSTYQLILLRDVYEIYDPLPVGFASCLQCFEATISPDFRHCLIERAFVALAEEDAYSHLLLLDPAVRFILFASDRGGPFRLLASSESPPAWGPGKHFHWSPMDGDDILRCFDDFLVSSELEEN